MSTDLVGPDGKPVSSEEPEVVEEVPDICPNCGAPEKKFERYQMFGGHWKLLCNKCGHTIQRGRD